VQLALWLVLAGRNKTPPASPGTVVLHYGWKLRFLGLCIAFAIPMLIILLLAASMRQTGQVVPIGVLLLLAGLAGGVLLVETQGLYVVVTESGILGISPWRGRREWRWDQIEQVSYSRVNRWLIVRGPQHQVIRASFYLVNIRDLAQAVLRHVSGPKCTPARQLLDRLAAS
jgi:hypothetical protein